MTQEMLTTAAVIAQELNAKVSQVETAIRLLDDGATVPFIARYRKEATAGLDDTQLRLLAERLHYLRDLDERRVLVLQTIREQDKLTKELEQVSVILVKPYSSGFSNKWSKASFTATA